MEKSKAFGFTAKAVEGNEGSKCLYPTRLDTYGCGCQHDCSYCYAKSLLSFRGLWNNERPSVAQDKDIKREIRKLKRGSVVRLGGMTDCFMPLEKWERATYRAIQDLNKRDIEYLIVTKSATVADYEYMKVMRPDLAHIQITVTSTDDARAATYEKASPPSKRIKAIEKLASAGFDVALRLSPFIPQFVDMDIINSVKCDKIVVEFLRVNHWIKQWFDIDYSDYTLKHGGYEHLPLERKVELLQTVHFPQITVCEDVDEHYEYWKQNVNYNPEDCCNLRRDAEKAEPKVTCEPAKRRQGSQTNR